MLRISAPILSPTSRTAAVGSKPQSRGGRERAAEEELEFVAGRGTDEWEEGPRREGGMSSSSGPLSG